jgi:hypothetical protein
LDALSIYDTLKDLKPKLNAKQVGLGGGFSLFPKFSSCLLRKLRIPTNRNRYIGDFLGKHYKKNPFGSMANEFEKILKILAEISLTNPSILKLLDQC